MRNYGQNINLNLVTYFGRFFHRSINRVNSVSRRNYVPFSRSEPLSDSDSDSVTKIVIYRFWLWSQGTVRFLSLKSTERLTILIQALSSLCPSLCRSKGFRLVSGRPSEKWNENQKMKEGGGGGEESIPISFFPTPSPLFCLRHFSRGLWLSFLVLCS